MQTEFLDNCLLPANRQITNIQLQTKRITQLLIGTVVFFILSHLRTALHISARTAHFVSVHIAVAHISAAHTSVTTHTCLLYTSRCV